MSDPVDSRLTNVMLVKASAKESNVMFKVHSALSSDLAGAVTKSLADSGAPSSSLTQQLE
jgi:hypothetical protein